jgi:hypothetical protein
MPRAESASVVTRLTDFLREPARHRPRYTHGRETLAGGHHVFRFAQGKFPPGLLHDTPTHRREELQRAAAAFVRQVCFWDGATYYQILCVEPTATRETIKEHYHLLMALIHPDRCSSSVEPFPPSWPQRANQAYAVLCDPRQRGEYDSVIAVSAKAAAAFAYPGSPQRPGKPVRSANRRKAAYTKAAIVSAAIVSMLLLVEVWYAEAPHEYSLFQGLGHYGRKHELPRYLGSEPVAPRAAMTLPTGRVHHEKPTVAASARHREAAMPPPADDERGASKPGPIASRPFLAAPPVLLVAQSDVSTPVQQAAMLTSEEIETVVVRLIGYYESGEADRLMGLIASDGGYWKNARIRQSYADFFRATRERHLRVESLQWEKAALTARARGEALLEASYVDDSPMLDRRVSVEVDIALRDGEAKITRLSLYPHAP